VTIEAAIDNRRVDVTQSFFTFFVMTGKTDIVPFSSQQFFPVTSVRIVTVCAGPFHLEGIVDEPVGTFDNLIVAAGAQALDTLYPGQYSLLVTDFTSTGERSMLYGIQQGPGTWCGPVGIMTHRTIPLVDFVVPVSLPQPGNVRPMAGKTEFGDRAVEQVLLA
jgi:hypothetical protein